MILHQKLSGRWVGASLIHQAAYKQRENMQSITRTINRTIVYSFNVKLCCSCGSVNLVNCLATASLSQFNPLNSSARSHSSHLPRQLSRGPLPSGKPLPEPLPLQSTNRLLASSHFFFSTGRRPPFVSAHSFKAPSLFLVDGSPLG